MQVPPGYYPAKFADASALGRLNEKARTLGLGSEVPGRLFDDANRAVLHVGHAVSTDRMAGQDVPLGDATLWTVSGDREVLLVVWWIRLRAGPIVAMVVCVEPDDFQALDDTVIGQDMLDRAHEIAGEWLTAAGQQPPS